MSFKKLTKKEYTARIKAEMCKQLNLTPDKPCAENPNCLSFNPCPMCGRKRGVIPDFK